MIDFKRKPNIIPWPPIILVSAIVCGWLVHMIWPLDTLEGLTLWPLGAGMIVAALATDLWAFRTFNIAHTTIMPNKRSKHLVTHGPFAWSRNPIYVGNVVLISGIGLVSGNFWQLIAAAIGGILIEQLAIKREEKHLELNFAEHWKDYTSRVRRWL